MRVIKLANDYANERMRDVENRVARAKVFKSDRPGREDIDNSSENKKEEKAEAKEKRKVKKG